MSGKRTLYAVLLAAGVSAACSDGDHTPMSPATAPNPTSQLAATQEQATLDEIARAVALALQDQGLRERIKNDMRGSPYWEHKLDFRTYLHGKSGGILLAKMAKETGRTRDEVLALVGRVRPLEMYFPVRAHRESWTGGADLQVLGHLTSSGAPTAAYALTGASVPVPGGDVAPAMPTLAIVQRETDFSEPLDLSGTQNLRDKGGQSIGTYVQMLPVDCEFQSEMQSETQGGTQSTTMSVGGEQYADCGGGGGGTYVPPSTTPRYRSTQGYGLREVMTEYKQPRSLDGWFQGDPELYVEVTSHAGLPGDPFRPYFTAKSRFGAGQDDSSGWHPAGFPHLISWNAEYGNYIHLKFYEDDGGSLINFSITFQGKTYGIRIPAEREDLGAWTYSFNDQSLIYGIDGHGAGMFGANNGFFTFITDYRVY
ncbi:MAG TPA: hypothetical protein VHG91_08510 [Longimicrobium sp.]|nr:hypothetical protein [Longimicrobium sp.]